jgi:peptidoglycan/LPS O-acetylase OafA/YrhL
LSLIWHNAPVFFINQWCLFALGAAIAEWLDKPTALVPALVITSLCDALMHLTIGEVVAASSAFVLVVMAVSARFAWINREPVLHRLGDWSYSLYLTHVPIGVWVALGVDPYPRTLGASSFCLHLAFDAFAFTVCVVFAFVFWNLVERPAIAMSHRKSSRRGRSDIVA